MFSLTQTARQPLSPSDVLFKFVHESITVTVTRAVASGSAGPVLAGPVFRQRTKLAVFYLRLSSELVGAARHVRNREIAMLFHVACISVYIFYFC